eukprot:m.253554 g.253554  ORF g.253554 m.253554 type:complete len:964 (+) comp19134_c0_seq7:199-3090(+)
MRVIVLGSGARESTLAYKIASETITVTSTVVVPGNAGINCPKYNLSSDPASTVDSLLKTCGENDLIIIGPEAFLEQGAADRFNAAGIKCFGPTKVASRIEWDRLAGKQIMEKLGIPTPAFKILSSAEDALAFCKSCEWDNFVIKRLGLCGGKGSYLPASLDEAADVLKTIFAQGDQQVLVERRIEIGHEFSATVVTDGTNVALFPFSQDHKRLSEFDEGPNTGGQGSCCPCQDWADSAAREAVVGYFQGVVDLLRAEGTPYVGAITGNLMVDLDEGKINILEMNARFGDPETQTMIPLLKTNLTDVIMQCVLGRLDPASVKFNDDNTSAVCIVLSTPDTNVRPIPKAVALPHAAFSRVAEGPDGGLVTKGSGRTLSLTYTGPTIAAAARDCYAAVNTPQLAEFYSRPDIAARQFRKINIAVLGSTRGTDLQFLLDRISENRLQARVTYVLSNKEDAYILERAKKHGIAAHHCGGKDFEQKMLDVLDAGDPKDYPDLVLLIGFMRILRGPLLSRFEGCMLNVHPSLLPLFAGGMDSDVHAAVLEAKATETGCTVHQVTSEVDAGEICVQLKCPVEADDTPDTLKARVQALEGRALAQAIRLFQMDALPGASVDKYKLAGVDVKEAQRLVDDHIVDIAKSTPHPEYVAPIGGFSAVIDMDKVDFVGKLLPAGVDPSVLPKIAVTVDGVGTKIILAHEAGLFFEVGIDLVAMNTNDLVAQFSKPIVFADYFSTSKLTKPIMLKVLEGVAEGCRQSDCRLACGETAEMPGLYKPAEQFDVAGFAVGAVVPFGAPGSPAGSAAVAEGDVLLGISSAGLHSNGFSLVRKIVSDANVDLTAPPPFESDKATIGEALLVPTRIYVKDIFEHLSDEDRACVKSMAHITGGGFPKNVPRSLPAHLTYDLNYEWPVPPVYGWLQKVGNLTVDDCVRTFNYGVGMVLVVDPANVDRFLANKNTTYHVIGKTVKKE